MLAVVASPSPTEQHFVCYRGADSLLRPEDLDRAYIQSARILVYGSVTLTAGAREAALEAARIATAAGGCVLFDVNLRPTLWPDLETARQEILQAAKEAAIVKLNGSELEFLTGTSDPARGARQLLDEGVRLCCVSLGGEGAYFDNGIASGYVPAFRVEVKNTLGSGDAFVAGLASTLVQTDTPVEEMDAGELRWRIRFANGCGALAATQLGGMSALPRKTDIEQFLKNAGHVHFSIPRKIHARKQQHQS